MAYTLKDILASLDSNQLAEALAAFDNYTYAFPDQAADGLLDSEKRDYRQILKYWAQGYRDPDVARLLHSVQVRIYRKLQDLMLRQTVKKNGMLYACAREVMQNGGPWDASVVRQKMELFVSDIAMLQLEPPHVREEKQQQLLIRQQRIRSVVFKQLLVSPQWTEADARAYVEILTSPTVDVIDQQLMASAITLSLFNFFDFNKWKALLETCSTSTETKVRQRALVGWAMGTYYCPGCYRGEMTGLLVSAMASEEAAKELESLQLQVLCCMNAENDTRRIRDEIMPDLMKNNAFRLNEKGEWIEKEEDPIANILHPDAENDRMEQVEQSFKKMYEMQQNGADIYFGGFAQTKRIPFFHEISNWFVPYYPEHPEVQQMLWKVKKGNKIAEMAENGPFCDSDKYSFVYAFTQVMERMPPQLGEMMDSHQLMFGPVSHGQEVQSPAYIRQTYLQMLYRYFKISTLNAGLCNPFDRGRGETGDLPFLFIADEKLLPLLSSHLVITMTGFLLSHQYEEEAAWLMKNFVRISDKWDYETCMIMAKVTKEFERYYRKALEYKEGDASAMLGLARVFFAQEKYEDAIRCYEQLLKETPERKNLQLEYATCLTNLGRADEALPILYKLDYEHPDHAGITRVLAWALTQGGKYEQAEKTYERLLGLPQTADTDKVYYGLSLWAGGKAEQAATAFCQYLQPLMQGTADSTRYFEKEVVERERNFISAHFSETEILLMRDYILIGRE
ncbi:MAG: tetratricopeptide repeat protein [Prevotella sp.]